MFLSLLKRASKVSKVAHFWIEGEIDLRIHRNRVGKSWG